MRARTILLAVLVICRGGMAVRADNYAPKVGEPHADFTLPDIATGKPISLSNFRGKKVLLIQFASW